MSLVGFKSTNHPQQTRYRGSNRNVDDRALTAEDFQPLQARFGFTIDAAASAQNAKTPKFFTESDNGLAQSWAGERVYCNPPYSNIRPWVKKAWAESSAEIVVMLLPANRTEQKWWQDLVEPYRDQKSSRLSVEFLPGRIRFLKPNQTTIGPNERPPFGCCLCIWNSLEPSLDANDLFE